MSAATRNGYIPGEIVNLRAWPDKDCWRRRIAKNGPVKDGHRTEQNTVAVFSSLAGRDVYITPRDHTLLQVIPGHGRRYTLRALAAFLGMDPGSLRARLVHLHRLGLLFRKARRGRSGYTLLRRIGASRECGDLSRRGTSMKREEGSTHGVGEVPTLERVAWFVQACLAEFDAHPVRARS